MTYSKTPKPAKAKPRQWGAATERRKGVKLRVEKKSWETAWDMWLLPGSRVFISVIVSICQNHQGPAHSYPAFSTTRTTSTVTHPTLTTGRISTPQQCLDSGSS